MSGGVNAHPRFPQQGEFYRRVLDHVPTPIIVIDDQGRVIYANLAGIEVGGWTPDEGVGMNTFDQIHPDDLGWAAEVFGSVLDYARDATGDEAGRWGSVHFRMIDATGKVIPLEVTGASALGDPIVNGVIYDLRPEWGPDLTTRVLRGLARGEPIDDLLAMVNEMVAIPPVAVDVVTVDVTDPTAVAVVAMTASAGALATATQVLTGAPWIDMGDDVVATDIADLASESGRQLLAIGYDHLWYAPVRTPGSPLSYRIVAAASDGVAYNKTIFQRLQRASDLASVVLLRAHNDAMLRHAATHDSLTQLASRRTLYEELDLDGPGAEARTDEDIAVLYLDLDGFKAVNDQHGHAAGDAVLQVVADRLRSCTRPDDLVSRVGGDEFVVVLPHPIDEAVAGEIAERIRAAIAEPTAVAGADVTVTASIGIVIADRGVDADRLVAEADAAMYEVKRASKGATALRHLAPGR